MSEYKKGKYSFSLAPALVLVGKEIVEERKNQVEGFIRELEDYNIILRDLAEEEVSLDLRNELLNIAMYISENAEIYNEFYEKKELPINKISKVVLKPKQFLQKWKSKTPTIEQKIKNRIRCYKKQTWYHKNVSDGRKADFS